MSGRIDVLHLVNSRQRRGAETFALGLHHLLLREGWSSDIVAIAGEDEPAELQLRAIGRRGPRTLPALLAEARRARVIVAHGAHTLFAGALVSALTGLPWIYRTIGDPSFWSTQPLRRARVRAALARADVVVTLWGGAARTLSRFYGVPLRRITVIPNGADADRFAFRDHRARDAARLHLGLAPETPVAVAIGALSHEKGLDVALDAVALVPDALLLVAGGGPEGPGLGRHAERVAPGRVRFLGVVADPATLLGAADVVVVPSRTEGMAAVVIEAAMVGVPVVASAVGATVEMIEHGRTGLLVPPEDVDALASALQHALGGRFDVGRARHDAVARYDLRVVADAWSRLLDAFVPRRSIAA